MVSGILTEEVRVDGVRTAFRIRNLETGEEGFLATKAHGDGPRIGSYAVNTVDLERIGASSLQNAARGESWLIFIDEVGPMEMTSELFRRALAEVLSSSKTVIASVKYGSHYREVEEASKLTGTITLTMSRENRDSLLSDIMELIGKSIGQ